MGVRDIGVGSMVLKFGWGWGGFVGLVYLTSRSSSGLLFLAGVFCLQGSVMSACVWLHPTFH